MKKSYVITILILLSLFSYVLCRNSNVKESSPELTYNKIELSEKVIKKDPVKFILETAREYGVYYFSGEDTQYILLNNNMVGGIKPYLTDLTFKLQEKTLNVYVSQELTENTKDNYILYRFSTSDKYDSIKVYRNGIESSFDHNILGYRE